MQASCQFANLVVVRILINPSQKILDAIARLHYSDNASRVIDLNRAFHEPFCEKSLLQIDFRALLTFYQAIHSLPRESSPQRTLRGDLTSYQGHSAPAEPF